MMVFVLCEVRVCKSITNIDYVSSSGMCEVVSKELLHRA